MPKSLNPVRNPDLNKLLSPAYTHCTGYPNHRLHARTAFLPTDIINDRWREYAPNDLVTNDSMMDARARAPCMPDIDLGVREGRFEIIRFRNVLPGDVIIHHPNCVHGSGANVSVSKRRLAASIRYVGGGVRWLNKKTNPSAPTLTRRWVLERRLGLGSKALFLGRRCAHFMGLLSDSHMYRDAAIWAGWEMKDGQPLDAIDIARIAFPVVWQSQGVRGDGKKASQCHAHSRSKL